MADQTTRNRLEGVYNASPGGVIKNCETCAHQVKGSFYSECSLTGYTCKTQRQFPAPPCDVNLSGWAPKPPTLWQRILNTFLK
jgi:hypothetical protein